MRAGVRTCKAPQSAHKRFSLPDGLFTGASASAWMVGLTLAVVHKRAINHACMSGRMLNRGPFACRVREDSRAQHACRGKHIAGAPKYMYGPLTDQRKGAGTLLALRNTCTALHRTNKVVLRFMIRCSA